MKDIRVLTAILLCAVANVAIAQRQVERKFIGLTFNYFVATYSSNKAHIKRGKSLCMQNFQKTDKYFKLSDCGYSLTVTKEKPEVVSTAPDIYDKFVEFEGNAVIFDNTEMKSWLGLTSKEYAAIKGKYFLSFSDEILGIVIWYVTPKTNIYRGYMISTNEQLADHFYGALQKHYSNK